MDPGFENERSPSASSYLTVLRVRKWSVLVVAALALVIGVGASLLLPKEYTATTKVALKESAPITPVSNPATAEQAVAESNIVARTAQALMKTKQSPKTLLEHVSVDVAPNAPVLPRGTPPAPRRCCSIAGKFAGFFAIMERCFLIFSGLFLKVRSQGSRHSVRMSSYGQREA